MTMMTPEDERDVRLSFDALDEDRTGRIGLEALHILWLALGYGRITEADLKLQVEGSSFKMGEVLTIFSKVSVRCSLCFYSSQQLIIP